MTATISPSSSLKPHAIDTFKKNGFLVINNMVSGERLREIQQAAQTELGQPKQPWELEIDTGYTGAPKNEGAEGAHTVRRLLRAYDRQESWKNWAFDPTLKRYLQQLLAEDDLYMSQAHHNCLMTKAPEYSSDTGWHQDIRYWSFASQELISVWLPLGAEKAENGSLVVIPGSHNMHLDRHRFDERLFFDPNFEANQALIEQATTLELNAGDVLLFHSQLLHRASRNHTKTTKLSLVFTYRRGNNFPIEGSRSASLEDIAL